MKVVLILCLALSWFLSGLVINACQLLAFLLIKPFNRGLFRKLNYALTYSLRSQFLTITEHVGQSRVRVFFKDDKSEQAFGQRSSLVICNHSFEVEWLMLWMAIDKWSLLASGKAMVKRVIRWFPVMGWDWFFNECVFLARNWNEDQQILSNCLDVFLEYTRPVMILLFCEGTRRTPDKFRASQEFAKKRGLEPLKHHLMPRPRGFVHCCRHSDAFDLFNIQVAFSPDSNEPNFYSVLFGLPVKSDLYIELLERPKDNEEEFLLALYRTKDELMDYHEKQHKFPGKLVDKTPRLLPLLLSVFWFGVSSVLIILLACKVGVVLVSSVFVISLLSILVLINSTRAKRGSSYGKSQ